MHFNTVEINSTFYRFPFPNMVKGWSNKVSEDFSFAVKGTRRVTHFGKLRDVREVLQSFLERMKPLKQMRVVLWQLPPSLDKDLKLLGDFLKLLPKWVRHTVEFRHRSWFEDNEDVLTLLRRHNVAFCGVSHPRFPAELPVTSDFAYVRFHGLGKELYHYLYSEHELQPWAKKIRSALRKKCEVYVYFNNDYHCYAITNARQLKEMI
jgi:uncharacterized protein YecE (DUF72 family)